MDIQSFESMRGSVFQDYRRNIAVLNTYHNPAGPGPIYPGLVENRGQEAGEVSWRLIGVTAVGRKWDLSSSSYLSCAHCDSIINLDECFQHAGNPDCFVVSESRLEEARLAFLRWAIIKAQLQVVPEADCEAILDLILFQQYTHLGENENYPGLLEWANSEYWFIFDQNSQATEHSFLITEAIIHLLNQKVLASPGVHERALFMTPFPPGSNCSEELERIQTNSFIPHYLFRMCKFETNHLIHYSV